MWIAFYTLMVLFVFVALVMSLLILIQKGRGGGLASAFGGSGGHTAFGSKTGDVLTWATSIVFGVFVILTLALNLIAYAIHEKNVALPTTQPSALSPSPSQEPVLPSDPLPAGDPSPSTTPSGSSEGSAPTTRPQ